MYKIFISVLTLLYIFTNADATRSPSSHKKRLPQPDISFSDELINATNMHSGYTDNEDINFYVECVHEGHWECNLKEMYQEIDGCNWNGDKFNLFPPTDGLSKLWITANITSNDSWVFRVGVMTYENSVECMRVEGLIALAETLRTLPQLSSTESTHESIVLLLMSMGNEALFDLLTNSKNETSVFKGEVYGIYDKIIEECAETDLYALTGMFVYCLVFVIAVYKNWGCCFLRPIFDNDLTELENKLKSLKYRRKLKAQEALRTAVKQLSVIDELKHN